MVQSHCFLFGSAARGDADEASDTDVLIVYSREPSPPTRLRAKQFAKQELGKECTFAEYTRARLEVMFDQGHLFAWHLYQEAQPIRGMGRNNGAFSFQRPQPYSAGRVDARNFLDLLRSSARAIERRTTSLIYECGLSYLAIRNIGISLSPLALPRPSFERHAPFKVAKALGMPPPCELNTYDSLIAARHSSQRGLVAPNLDPEVLAPELAAACRWAENSLETVDDLARA